MKIYNQEKTKIIEEPNLELGYLDNDKLFVKHHPATETIIGKTASQQANELREIGYDIMVEDDIYYVIVSKNSDGNAISRFALHDVPDIPAQEAYDEYEDILVYIPYTEEQLEEIEKEKLRERRRIECFEIYNQNHPEGYYTKEQIKERDKWYYEWLNVTDTKIIPQRPIWLK